MREPKVLLAAQMDLDDAFNWYEDQREGLGEEFITTVRTTVLRTCEAPERFPVAHRHLRRVLVSRFPFGIFYTFDAQTVFIHAVFHSKRDPQILWTR